MCESKHTQIGARLTYEMLEYLGKKYRGDLATAEASIKLEAEKMKRRRPAAKKEDPELLKSPTRAYSTLLL